MAVDQNQSFATIGQVIGAIAEMDSGEEIAPDSNLDKAVRALLRSLGDTPESLPEISELKSRLQAALDNFDESWGDLAISDIETNQFAAKKVALNKQELQSLLDEMERSEIDSKKVLSRLAQKQRWIAKNEVERIIKFWQEEASKLEDQIKEVGVSSQAKREIAKKMASAVVVEKEASVVVSETREIRANETIREIIIKTIEEKQINDRVLTETRGRIEKAFGRLPSGSRKIFERQRDAIVRNVARMVVQVTAIKEADRIITSIETARSGVIPPIDRVRILREVAEAIESKVGKDLVLVMAEVEADIKQALGDISGESGVTETIRTEVATSAKAVESSKTNNPIIYFNATRAMEERQIIDWATAKNVDMEKTSELIELYLETSGNKKMERSYLAIRTAKQIEVASSEKSEVVIDRATNETEGFLGMLRTRDVRGLVGRWSNIRQALGGNLPEMPSIQALDRIVGVLERNPEIMKLAESAQKALSVWDSVNGLTGQVLSKLGVEKAGMAFLEKIGGQEMVAFAGEAIKAFGSVNTTGGMANIVSSLLKQLISKGAISGTTATAEAGATAAGGTAATGGLTGLIAAFQALPVVGQIIAVAAITVAAAIWAYKKFIKPVLTKIKGFLASLGIDTDNFNAFSGLKRSLKENLGGFIGGVLGFGLDIANLGIWAIGVAFGLSFMGIMALVTWVTAGIFIFMFVYQLLVPNSLGSTLAPSREVMMVTDQETGTGDFTPVDPIYGENCESTLACVALEALFQNQFERVVRSNVGRAATVLRSLIGKFPFYNIARFISVMVYNTNRFNAFQCIGYSIAADTGLTTSPSWPALYAGTQKGCVKVAPENAGIGDHIVFPLKNGHYHIGVLVKVRQDGSAMMYDVNTDGNGLIHRWPIMNLANFVSGDNSRNRGQPLTILRCGV